LAVRIKDIAKLANVSVGTIDRVIHDRGEVSESTRKRVKAILRELNYQPDIFASTLASKKTSFFSVLMPVADNGNSFWNAPGKGIDKAVKELSHFGIQVKKFMFNQFDRDSFAAKAFDLLADTCDGVLFAPVFFDDSIKFIRECHKKNLPVVLFNSLINDIPICCYIGQDSEKSGYLGAKLIHYGLHGPGDLLVINIAPMKDNYDQILSREQSFRRYFSEHPEIKVKIHTIMITHTSEEKISKDLKTVFSEKKVKGIFVTNSRVSNVAGFISNKKIGGIRLVGYDLLPENIRYLKKGVIDFLVSQRPEEQGYLGIMTLFNYVVLRKKVEPKQFIPIDIITKENIDYYEYINK